MGLKEGGMPEPRGSVLDSCHGLRVSVRQHSATAAAATATAAQMLSPKDVDDLQHLQEHLQDQCRRFGLSDEGDVDDLLDRVQQHVQRAPVPGRRTRARALRDAHLAWKRETDLAEVLAPKVTGALALREALAELEAICRDRD